MEKLGRQQQFYESKGRFKGLLFGIALAIIVALLVYTEQLVDNLRSESRNILQYYASLNARAASVAASSDLEFIFEEIIRKTYFPIINVSPTGIPNWWKGIGDIGPEKSPENLAKVNEIKNRMGEIGAPIPITFEADTLGYLYYGDSSTITRLRWLPFIQFGLAGLFILVGFIGFSTIKRSEERFIWVGMAKETAHQLGTPLSSLMGWIQLLRDRSYNRPETIKVIEEMEDDAGRLRKVAERFSQIGSQADLHERDLNKIVHAVGNYIRRRLPQMQKKINIEENFSDIPPIRVNADLMEWVLENLVKNAIDSINHESGLIRLVTGRSDRKEYTIFVDISDNGRGITSKNRYDIFRPGYSTKKRGWGLGLNLSKRIVEEYHKGKLVIRDSEPGTGTTLRIYL